MTIRDTLNKLIDLTPWRDERDARQAHDDVDELADKIDRVTRPGVIGSDGHSVHGDES